ncbi:MULTISPECIES: serine hydrolase domain-containing protein [Streptomyces]|uniref:Serine hydrolase domain-containing protein n=1 Tax=Streptomyces pratisoli TaxID=3139917 RepID=A0ACC6QB49_9ACTN|nr:serine hydrolase domain-containing protein [Streptomyces sp. NBC_00259]
MLVLVICVGAGAFLAPAPPGLGSSTTGDASLAERVRHAAGDGRGYRGISAVLIDRGRLTFAGLGDSGNPARRTVDASTVFEGGSIGKPMTGMLLAELEDQKIIDLNSPLERYLPDSRFSDPVVAQSTLRDLATHRSGLDKMPDDLDMSVRNLKMLLFGKDPYRGLGGDDVLRAGEDASAGSIGAYRYSNLGPALAGNVVSHYTDLSYSQLLSAYLLKPLNMRDSRIVERGDPLPRNSAHGQQSNGALTDHWFASGYTPAGDIWTTANDLGLFLRAVMEKTAPGVRAAVPVHNASPGSRTGMGWLTSATRGHEITWHNGATGGFTSYMGFDRATQRGVVLLSNTDRPVDAIGERLLGLPTPGREPVDIPAVLGTILATSGAPVPLLAARLWRRPRVRWKWFVLLCIHVIFGAVSLWLGWRLGSWLNVPSVLWTVGFGGLTLGALASFIQFMPSMSGGAGRQLCGQHRIVRTSAAWTGILAILLLTQL